MATIFWGAQPRIGSYTTMLVKESDLGIINVNGISKVRLGRLSEGNDQVLPHPAVSAHHAILEKTIEGKWFIRDLNSDFGTYVNLLKVSPMGCQVSGDDIIWIAPYAFRITEETYSEKPKPVHLKLDVVNLFREVSGRILLDLHGTPLSFRPGEFMAVVGGSGAGKSTLLKALLGLDTISKGGRKGDIYLNNLLLIRDSDSRSFSPLNSIIGYVPQQDDSIHFSLTPKQALSYMADLRFAKDVNKQEKQGYINEALQFVRLDSGDLQNKKISKLSGGQRKRVNIAMELLTRPRILFLDEPTSGLDPGLDLELMQLFKNWSSGEHNQDPKTIVLITHATENVRLCDYIVFMGKRTGNDGDHGGSMLFFGPPDETAWTFFGCDHLAEIYQTTANPDIAEGFFQKLTEEDEWRNLIWNRARSYEDIRMGENANVGHKEIEAQKPAINKRLFRRQFTTLASRYWRLIRNDSGALFFQLIQGILVALLIWSVAAADSFSLSGIRNAPTTLFIMSIAATWLGMLNSSKEIVKEKRIFGRETRYGIGPLPYVLSKFAVLGLMGVWQILSLLVFILIRFQLVSQYGTFGRLLPDFIQFLSLIPVEWFITLELQLLAGLSIGLLISSISKTIDQATLLMFLPMLIQVLLAGLLFDVGALSWISFTYWGISALGNSMNLASLFAQAGKASDPVLDTLNLSGDPLRLILCWLMLIIMIVIFLSLSVLRQSKEDKARIMDD